MLPDAFGRWRVALERCSVVRSHQCLAFVYCWHPLVVSDGKLESGRMMPSYHATQSSGVS